MSTAISISHNPNITTTAVKMNVSTNWLINVLPLLRNHNHLSSGNLFLKRINDSTYWTGSGWGGSMAYLATSVAGNNLSIQDMDEPISTFASERYGIVWGYSGESPTIYGDYAPSDPNCPIPSFPWVLVLFSVLTIMGICNWRAS